MDKEKTLAPPAEATPDQAPYVKPELAVVGPLRQVTGFDTFFPPAEGNQESTSSD